VSATRRAATLPVSFFDRPADTVARDLLGTVVVSRAGGRLTAGRIVETEAYLGRDDPASHGYRHRRNERNAALFGPPASWYVYLSYGMHWCANLVCEAEGRASAVLLRALEPLDGLDTMRRRRGGVEDRLLCAGPGRLCQALGITRALDGAPMAGSPVAVVAPAPEALPPAIVATTRIGITKAAEWPLRFVVEGSAYLSKGLGTKTEPPGE
jgi:DNA-3-methyladenine glycosylase